MASIILGYTLIVWSIIYTICQVKTRIKNDSVINRYINFKGVFVGVLIFIGGLLFIFEKVKISNFF